MRKSTEIIKLMIDKGYYQASDLDFMCTSIEHAFNSGLVTAEECVVTIDLIGVKIGTRTMRDYLSHMVHNDRYNRERTPGIVELAYAVYSDWDNFDALVTAAQQANN